MPKPICFMVMPFGTKETGAKAPAPSKINFNSLWQKALSPAIEKLGYQPVRADQELGALIIQEMLERLYFSDLVIADLTIPNGNVYYEIGIRHAARHQGCVLIGAEWSNALFDVNQMRQLRYPLPAEEVDAETVEKIREILERDVPAMAKGTGPMFQTLPGYPDEKAVDPTRASAIKGFLEQLSAFQAEVRAVAHAPAGQQRELSLALRDKYHNGTAPTVPSVAIELLHLLRDHAKWDDALAFIDSLPQAIQLLPTVREQRCLALSKTGDHAAAIGALEELIKLSGATSEREGLIGGRFKSLYRSAAEPQKPQYLSEAIKHYERGMKLDLNDYYPSCNLPRLYQARGRSGDEDRARAAATVARLACQRELDRNAATEWTRPTLLGMAFDAGDVAAAEEICDQVSDEGAARWKLDTTLTDLKQSAAQARDADTRAGLEAVCLRLAAMV
jgi:tetratricopeptide (TPR) repeat protein